MNFIDDFNSFISSKNWDHMKFLQILLFTILFIILLFFTWILILTYNGIVQQDFLKSSLKETGYGILFGIITGIVISVIYLLNYYLKKQWDLHVIVPNFLRIFMIEIIILYILSFIFFKNLNLLTKNSFIIGFVVGGLISIIAYAAEVKKEHTSDDEILSE